MSETRWIKSTQLNEEHREVVEFKDFKNRLITGPPGSGKTNILLLRAKYLSKVSRPNLQIVVFTRALRKFIASGTEYYGVPTDRIVTSTKWANGLLYSYGIKPNPPEGFPEQRAYYAERVSELVERNRQ